MYLILSLEKVGMVQKQWLLFILGFAKLTLSLVLTVSVARISLLGFCLVGCFVLFCFVCKGIRSLL